MFFTLLCGAVGAFAVYAYYQLYLHPLAKFPGPPLAALTDFYHAYLCSTMHRPEYLRKLHAQYGDCIRLQSNMLYINTAESIEQIYKNRDFLKAPRYKTIESTDNIFTCTDPKEYARRHRLVAPAFSPKNIEKFENETTRPLINKWLGAVQTRLDSQSSDVIDFTDWTDFIITDIIGAVVFGESFGYIQKQERHPGLHLIQNVLRAMSTISCMPNLKFILPLLVNPKTLYKGYVWTSSIEKYVRDCVARQDAGDVAARASICAKLRNATDETGDSLTIKELSDECMVFIIAGADTTAVALSNCFFYLAQNPEMQTKLVEEVREAFADREDIRAKVLAKLPYLQAVIQESMRIWPSATGHMERINYKEDTVISGFHVPKGCEIASNMMYITHDERNFHEPNTFKPERWIDPDCKDNLAASQPMQVGPRQCIGQSLGWQEMRLVIANLLWEYQLSPYDTVLDNRDVTATWRGKIRVRLTPRPSIVDGLAV